MKNIKNVFASMVHALSETNVVYGPWGSLALTKCSTSSCWYWVVEYWRLINLFEGLELLLAKKVIVIE